MKLQLYGILLRQRNTAFIPTTLFARFYTTNELDELRDSNRIARKQIEPKTSETIINDDILVEKENLEQAVQK